MSKKVEFHPASEASSVYGPYLDAVTSVYNRQINGIDEAQAEETRNYYFKVKKAQLDLEEVLSNIVSWLEYNSGV